MTLRWLSCDSMGMVNFPNVYVFVIGNVVHAVNPDGRFVTVCIISVASGIAISMGGCTRETEESDLQPQPSHLPQSPIPNHHKCPYDSVNGGQCCHCKAYIDDYK